MNIVVHTTPNCVQCDTTKRYMDKLGLEYTVIDLSERPDLVEQFKEQGHMAAPIVTAGNRIWSGFRMERINGLIAQRHHGD